MIMNPLEPLRSSHAKGVYTLTTNFVYLTTVRYAYGIMAGHYGNCYMSRAWAAILALALANYQIDC